MQSKILIVMLVLALSGCESQSGIQGKYAAHQKLCRGANATHWSWWSPSSWFQSANPTMASKAQFSDCMNNAGWHVPVPKPPGQVATGPVPNPPSGSPSTNPIASATSAPQPQAAAAAVQNPRPVYPPTGAPSVNPSAATARVPQPVAATYQPARPLSVPAPAYGTGGGRQF